jgi:hypothetical protein
MSIKFNNTHEFKVALEAGKIETPRFVNISHYENDNNEIASHLVNLGIHYGKALYDDYVLFSFMSIDDFDIPDELKYIAPKAYSEKINSLRKNSDTNRDNHTMASRRNLEMYETITPNIKRHKETGALYLVGLTVRKKVHTPGVYRNRKHQDKTKVKMIFDKVLRTSKYRMYHLEKIHSITINGNRMTINVEE